MDFDNFSVVLLSLRDDAPALSDDDAAALQDAHMSHLADLHEAGHLLAAGPLIDGHYRGLSILKVSPEMALTLKEADPAVQAGKFTVTVLPWLVPGGAVHFSPTRFPRSMAEIQ
jgi:uncharacterized protein YciI